LLLVDEEPDDEDEELVEDDVELEPDEELDEPEYDDGEYQPPDSGEAELADIAATVEDEPAADSAGGGNSDCDSGAIAKGSLTAPPLNSTRLFAAATGGGLKPGFPKIRSIPNARIPA
jgi:hypothetical protein